MQQLCSVLVLKKLGGELHDEFLEVVRFLADEQNMQAGPVSLNCRKITALGSRHSPMASLQRCNAVNASKLCPLAVYCQAHVSLCTS